MEIFTGGICKSKSPQKCMEVQLLGPDNSTMLEVTCWKSIIFKDIRVAIATPGSTHTLLFITARIKADLCLIA